MDYDNNQNVARTHYKKDYLVIKPFVTILEVCASIHEGFTTRIIIKRVFILKDSFLIFFIKNLFVKTREYDTITYKIQ